MEQTPSLPDVSPCSKLKRIAGRILAAALLLAVSATPAATADISFTGTVVNLGRAAFAPARAMVDIAGNHAIFDVAVSSPEGFHPAAVFTASAADGAGHPVTVLKSQMRRRVLLARVQVEAGGMKRQQILVCLENPAGRRLCGRFIINHLY
jgi:hypothetical protein